MFSGSSIQCGFVWFFFFTEIRAFKLKLCQKYGPTLQIKGNKSLKVTLFEDFGIRTQVKIIIIRIYIAWNEF